MWILTASIIVAILPGYAFTSKTCLPQFHSFLRPDGNPVKPVLIDPSVLYPSSIKSLVYIETVTLNGTFAGSGVFFDACGDIVTNNHVTSNAVLISVTLHDGTKYLAKIIGSDPNNDISVIRLIKSPLYNYYRFFANTNLASGDLAVGQKVYALGNPGEVDEALTEGMINKLNYILNVGPDVGIHPVIVFDAKINHGSSGGALLNRYGYIIGITEGGLVESGLEIAIPEDLVLNSILKIMAKYYSLSSVCVEQNLPNVINKPCVFVG